MIRICAINFRNISVILKHFHTSTSVALSNSSISKRFHSTEFLENATKTIDANEISALKKERQAEVHFWHMLKRNCVNPADITDEQWHHLCELDTKHQRQKFCRYLYRKKLSKVEKKERAKDQIEAKKEKHERTIAEREANEHIVYGLGNNSLLLRIGRQMINKWRNRKLLRAAVFGQKIIVDCSYGEQSSDLERSKIAKGLKRVFSENRLHPMPFDLHFCGVQRDDAVFRNLSSQIPNLFEKSSYIKLHSECFTKVFPREKLVILTPDSDTVFEYDPNSIYVVGGIVDLGRNEPLTLSKAKRLGIRTARFPLDNIRMKSGDTRELTMSTSIDIIRECQRNDDIKNVIDKCVKLRSQRVEEQKQRETPVDADDVIENYLKLGRKRRF